MSDLERQAWARLASVMDPETGISVVEMGLIRRVRPSEHGLSLVMTLTHAGCSLGAVILDRVREALRPLCPEGSIEIALSFDPPSIPGISTTGGFASRSSGCASRVARRPRASSTRTVTSEFISPGRT